MPLPDNFDLSKPVYVTVDATGQKVRLCNCGSQPHDKTLRYAGQNRSKFSPWPAPAKQSTEETPT